MTNMTICQCLTLTGDDETMTQRAELQIAVQNTALVFISEGKKRSARCRFFLLHAKTRGAKMPPPPTHTHQGKGYLEGQESVSKCMLTPCLKIPCHEFRYF